MLQRDFLILVLCLCLSTQTVLAQITPEVFGALPNVSDVEISPDGKTIAQIQSDADLRAVAFYDLAGVNKPMGVKLGSVKARDLVWAGPNHVMLLVSATKTVSWGRGLETHEVWRWIAIDRNSGSTAIPFKSYEGGYYNFGSGRLISRLPADPDHVLMTQWGARNLGLYRVGLKNASDELIEAGEDATVDWVADALGQPLVRIDYDGRDAERRFYMRKEGKGRFELVSTVAEKREDDEFLIASAPGEQQAVIHGLMSENGYWSLCAFDVAVGAKTGCDYSAAGYDIAGVLVDGASGRAVGVSFTDDLPRTRFIDADLKSVQSGLDKALAGASPVITSWTDDRTKFVVRAEYADHPPQFFLYDRPNKKLDVIAGSYAALDGRFLAAKERYDYVASDGLNIRGYLTIPKGASRRAMPLIVMPHGGPAARDDQAFDWWAFFYAARGYLVYQPNFRGSEGYGHAFRRAGYLEWGGKMQDDVSDGVRKLIADGLADPKRICIVGASYGGYAALAGATLTPDLYACAVSVAGVSNIPALIAYQTDRGSVPEDAWDVRIGARVSDNEKLRAVSPSYQAARAQAPVLLIHGKDDIVVPIGQSRMMSDALKTAKKNVTFVELPGEDHWLSNAATRTEMLRASIQFIDKHIGPK